MTDQELKDIVAAVVAELEKSGVDFDYKAEQAEDDDLVFVIRGTAPNYQGVTVTWKGLLDIITAQATQAKNDAETAKNAANTILEQVQSKGTEITNFVATSKTEIETQKDESVNAVKSVYQSDLNELKGDLVDVKYTNIISFELGGFEDNNGYVVKIPNNSRIRTKYPINLSDVDHIEILNDLYEYFLIICSYDYKNIDQYQYSSNLNETLSRTDYKNVYMLLVARNKADTSSNLVNKEDDVKNSIRIVFKEKNSKKVSHKFFSNSRLNKNESYDITFSANPYRISTVIPAHGNKINIKIMSNEYECLYVNKSTKFTTNWLSSGINIESSICVDIYITFRRKDNKEINIDEIIKNVEFNCDWNDTVEPIIAIDGLYKFSVKVNCNLQSLDADLNSGDNETIYTDFGILVLPKNYTQFGKPTRLVIVCHGAGVTPYETREMDNTGKIIGDPQRFLNKMGYAVMDMYANPHDFSNSDSELHFGNPIALQCYIKGYEYVVANYNIRTDGVFVCGSSMGGLTSFAIVQNTNIPVLAQSAFCPCVDLFKQAYCNPWASPSYQRSKIAEYYGFTGEIPAFTNNKMPTDEEINYFKDNIDKVLGYYPIINNLTNGNIMDIFNVVPIPSTDIPESEKVIYQTFRKIHRVPLKIWHCKDDQVVNYRYSEYLANMISKSGQICYLRPFSTGGHNAWANGETKTFIDVEGNEVNATASEYECYFWIKRFDA